VGKSGLRTCVALCEIRENSCYTSGPLLTGIYAGAGSVAFPSLSVKGISVMST